MTARVYTLAASVAGKQISGSVKRDGTTEANGETTLAAGSAGTLTTRTDNDTGVVTLTGGHGQTSGDFDVYWEGGCRRKMAGTVATNALTLDGGAGDNLPIATTAVVVDKIEFLDIDADAASIVLAAVSADFRASVQFQEADGTPIHGLDLGRYGYDGEAWVWADDTDTSTPFAEDVGKVAVSNGNSAQSNVIKVGLLKS